MHRGRSNNQRTKILALLLVVALALVLATAEGLRRRALYWYDVELDYVYAFGSNSANTLAVQVSPDGFVLPNPPGPGSTALLELRISSRWTGRWFEPCLEVSLGELRQVQCFERGARGRRYVLLPPLKHGADVRLALRGHHLNWEPQTTRVLWFEALRTVGKRVLVLAPHPDDAEIAAFGLYASHESYVATVTAGNYVDGLYSDLGLNRVEQDELRGSVRVWDSLVVPQLGSVPQDRTVNLGYLTYTLKTFHDAARPGSALESTARQPIGSYRQGAVDKMLGGRSASADWTSLVADLVALVQATKPDIIVTPHPKLDAHTDHQYTTIALLEALETLGDRSATLLMYTNHHVLSEHYPYGGSTAMVTLPPWFDELPVSSVYSFRLDPDTRLRKLFALEAMHDLRAPPLSLDTGAPADILIARLKQAAAVIKRDPFGDYSYFRRAVRPNELFFVYPPPDRPTPESLLSTETP